MYNVTNITDMLGAAEMAEGITGGIFFSAMLVVIFFVIFIYLYNEGITKAFLGSGFACAILSILLVLGGLASMSVVWLFVIITAVSLLLVFLGV